MKLLTEQLMVLNVMWCHVMHLIRQCSWCKHASSLHQV